MGLGLELTTPPSRGARAPDGASRARLEHTFLSSCSGRRQVGAPLLAGAGEPRRALEQGRLQFVQIPKVTVRGEAGPAEGRPQGRGRESRGKLGGGGVLVSPAQGRPGGRRARTRMCTAPGPPRLCGAGRRGARLHALAAAAPESPSPPPTPPGIRARTWPPSPRAGRCTWLHCCPRRPLSSSFPPSPGPSTRPHLCGARTPLSGQTPPGVGVVAAGGKGGETVSGSPDWPEARAAVACACALSSSARLRGVGGRPGANWPPRRPRPRVAGGHVTRRLGAPGAGDAGGQDGGGAGGGQSE